jgi:hypothetical protein
MKMALTLEAVAQRLGVRCLINNQCIRLENMLGFNAVAIFMSVNIFLLLLFSLALHPRAGYGLLVHEVS